jgi:pyridoxal/pyridoxine/pyridoxamine kinase
LGLQAHLHDSTLALDQALRKVAATLQAVIRRTFEHGGGELRLIQSKRSIEQPDDSHLTPIRLGVSSS